MACESGSGRVSEEEAMDLLEQSILYEDGLLSFTVPDVETPSHPWSILVAGRAEFADGMGMSVHYFTTTEWEPGEQYSEDLSGIAPSLTELNMDLTLGVTERSIDLLPYVQTQSGPAAVQGARYTSSLYGFTLDLPEAWRGQVDVEEFLGLPTFFMRDAGEYGGMLLAVTWTDSADYDEDTTPTPVYFLAERDGVTLYAYPATDVEFDPEVDEARYRALADGIQELLDSFTLAGAGSWPSVSGYGLLRGADESGVRLDLLEQNSFFEFTNSAADDTRMPVSPAAVAGVDGADGWSKIQIPYMELCAGLDQYLGGIFQIYTVDGVVVALNQLGEARVME